MSEFYVPANEAQELNAALPANTPFAYKNDEGRWVYNDLIERDVETLDRLISERGYADSLAAYIASLEPVPDLRCKIYRYVVDIGDRDPNEPPFDIDYRVDLDRRLHPKLYFEKGELVKREFYAQATLQPDGTVDYDDLIVVEDYVYHRDAQNFARSRTLTITWYREDGSPHPRQKVMEKIYDQLASIGEGQRKRRNIVDKLVADVSAFLALQGLVDEARMFFLQYGGEINAFLFSGEPALLQAVQNDTNFSWLDLEIQPGVTVRQYIVEELTP